MPNGIAVCCAVPQSCLIPGVCGCVNPVPFAATAVPCLSYSLFFIAVRSSPDAAADDEVEEVGTDTEAKEQLGTAKSGSKTSEDEKSDAPESQDGANAAEEIAGASEEGAAMETD